MTRKVAIVYGVPAGLGGLGLQAATALSALALTDADLHAFGPAPIDPWPLEGGAPRAHWHSAPTLLSPWRSRYTWLRWWQGRLVFQHDCRLGQWAAAQLDQLRPDACYLFSQVALESLHWAQGARVPTVLDSPTGHVRAQREVIQQEARRWGAWGYWGHPSAAMVARVEEEYHLADGIRVSSDWARKSLMRGGVLAQKISVIPQPVNLARFHPPAKNPTLARGVSEAQGPLRLCYVGSVDLRKGFVYLLRAMRLVGPERLRLGIVGATGDRCCRRFFERESRGLLCSMAPGDPLVTYQEAELFVLPSLEDGFGFVVAEAMACGLPVIVTDQCGAAEWVEPGRTGWIIPAGSAEKLAQALEEAVQQREALESMGQLARAAVEKRAGKQCLERLAHWFYDPGEPRALCAPCSRLA